MEKWKIADVNAGYMSLYLVYVKDDMQNRIGSVNRIFMYAWVWRARRCDALGCKLVCFQLSVCKVYAYTCVISAITNEDVMSPRSWEANICVVCGVLWLYDQMGQISEYDSSKFKLKFITPFFYLHIYNSEKEKNV